MISSTILYPAHPHQRTLSLTPNPVSPVRRKITHSVRSRTGKHSVLDETGNLSVSGRTDNFCATIIPEFVVSDAQKPLASVAVYFFQLTNALCHNALCHNAQRDTVTNYVGVGFKLLVRGCGGKRGMAFSSSRN